MEYEEERKMKWGKVTDKEQGSKKREQLSLIKWQGEERAVKERELKNRTEKGEQKRIVTEVRM